ncbi:MAG: hypothetical protein EU533_00425 [Promethearchaeota archaeon]|nr:MAG: hypothetical protein EU533_00425 [Candidatus Lokiarchaeota archaeon]
MPSKQARFETFKADAAPFFFYIDVLPLDLTQYEIPHHITMLKSLRSNSIMPIPLRVDRVYNGEPSILVRPREPVTFPIGENWVYINPIPFLNLGIEKLIYLTETRASIEFTSSLKVEDVNRWWNSTRMHYSKLKYIEEDFAAFLKAYIYTVVKAELDSEDLNEAAIKYCELVREICEKRINQNQILVEVKGKERIKRLYKMKEGKVFETRFKRATKDLLYPDFVDIEIMNHENMQLLNNEEKVKIKTQVKQYIPLLFYDDLLECMLQNIAILENEEGEIISPSSLIEKDIVVVLEDEPPKSNRYSWFQDFNEININKIMNSFEPTFPYDLK